MPKVCLKSERPGFNSALPLASVKRWAELSTSKPQFFNINLGIECAYHMELLQNFSGGLQWQSSGLDSALPLQGAWV